MEELRKFQCSTFDTIARRRLVEDQDTILELTGKIQELQNEINCMNDSKDFQDASLTEMEELRKLQSSTLDTMARRKLIEDQNTMLELSGRLQELQNEVNCMHDSKDFHAESVRSGNSTLPVDQCHSHLIRCLNGCCDILSYRRAAEKGRQVFGTHMVCRETFLQIQMRPHQHLILKN